MTQNQQQTTGTKSNDTESMPKAPSIGKITLDEARGYRIKLQDQQQPRHQTIGEFESEMKQSFC